MPFKAEDLAGDMLVIERRYCDELEEAHMGTILACEAVSSGRALMDVDSCLRMGKEIAAYAHAAKMWRVLAEAAIKDCRLAYEQAGEVWEVPSFLQFAHEAATNAIGDALRMFAAWSLDHEFELDRERLHVR